MADRPLHAPSSAFLGLSFLACACSGTPEAPVQEPARPPVRCALVIGVDGLRPDRFEQGFTPRMDALIAAGVAIEGSTNAWTPAEPWNGHSATNWGVLLTGVSPAVSELTANGDREHRVGRDNPAAPRVESIFGLVRAARPGVRTAVANTWPGILDADWTVLGRDRSVIDATYNPKGSGSSALRDVETTLFAAELLAHPQQGADGDLMFVHLSQVDAAGHAHTYAGEEYDATVAGADHLVGELLDAIALRATRGQEQWLVILTSDHGGPPDGKGHGDNGDRHVREIPFVVRADGVAFDVRPSSATLYDVAPTVQAWMTGDRGDLEGRAWALTPSVIAPPPRR